MNDLRIHLPNLGKDYLENGQFVYWSFCAWDCPKETTPGDHTYEETPGIFRSPIEVRDILISKPRTILKWRSPQTKTILRFAVLDADLQREFPHVQIQRGTIVMVAGKQYKADQHGFKRWWFQLCTED